MTGRGAAIAVRMIAEGDVRHCVHDPSQAVNAAGFLAELRRAGTTIAQTLESETAP